MLPFRKYNLDAIYREIRCNICEVEVWKPNSKKLDIVASWPNEAVMKNIKEGVVVCLRKLECRAVPTPHSFVYELFNDNRDPKAGIKIMNCNNVQVCRSRRLDREAREDFPYIGTINISQIWKGISFTLFCKVVKVGRENSTGRVVLRVKDSTFTKIKIKKYDLENLNQKNGEDEFHERGSAFVDVVITSLPQNLDLDVMVKSNKVMALGRVICDSHHDDLSHTVHVLYIDGSLPSFEVKFFNQRLRSVSTFERILARQQAKYPTAFQEYSSRDLEQPGAVVKRKRKRTRR